MRTLLPVRNFSKLALILERHGGILTTVNSHFNLRKPTYNHGRIEYVTPKIQNPSITLCRYMAKDKDKGKKSTKRMQIDERELSNYFDLETLYGDFEGVLNHFKKVLVEETSLRTSPNAIEQLKVKYGNDTYSIQDLAEVGKKGGKVILEMSSFFEAIPAVADALKKSALGLNPIQEGTVLIVPIPKVTREHREALLKGAKALLVKCRGNIQNVQNKYIKKADDLEGTSIDVIFRLKKQLTELGNKHIREAEEIYKTKEKELLLTD